MLAKIFRLRKKAEIEKTFKQGKTIKSKAFYLKYLPNQTKASRFCFVVGKKSVPLAHERNRAKRIMREAIRAHLSEINKGFDIAFFALPLIKEHDFHSLEKEMADILRRTPVWKNNA